MQEPLGKAVVTTTTMNANLNYCSAPNRGLASKGTHPMEKWVRECVGPSNLGW